MRVNSAERQKLRELAKSVPMRMAREWPIPQWAEPEDIIDLLDDIDRLKATVRRLVEMTSEEIADGTDGECRFCRHGYLPHHDDCPWLQAKREFGE